MSETRPGHVRDTVVDDRTGLACDASAKALERHSRDAFAFASLSSRCADQLLFTARFEPLLRKTRALLPAGLAEEPERSATPAPAFIACVNAPPTGKSAASP